MLDKYFTTAEHGMAACLIIPVIVVMVVLAFPFWCLAKLIEKLYEQVTR
jgi:hypothetical protein